MNNTNRPDFTCGVNGTQSHSNHSKFQNQSQMGYPFGLNGNVNQNTFNPFRQDENISSIIGPVVMVLDQMVSMKKHLFNTTAAGMYDIAIGKMASPAMNVQNGYLSLDNIEERLAYYRTELEGCAATEELVSFVEDTIARRNGAAK